MVHLVGVSELRQLLEKVVALLLLDLEFSVLNVEIEDSPDVLGLEFRDQLVLSVPRDVGDVAILTSEELEDFADFEFGLRDFLGKVLVSSDGQGVDDDVEDPLSFSFDFLLRRAESVSNFDLQSLRDVLLDDLEVVRSSKQVIDVLGHELVLERLGLVHLCLLVLVGGCRLAPLLKNLLLD